jgi:alpha-galactosidase
VGLFNRSSAGSTITANWRDIMISGKQRVRNLWSQKDLGIFENEFAALVPPHGVTLLRLFPSD